jgi:hypothetical protein
LTSIALHRKLRKEQSLVILFPNLKARHQLIDKGYVYTYRKNKRKKIGKDWACEGCGKPKLCDVYVHHLGGINTMGDIYPYIKGSGFRNIHEWLDAIAQLNKKPLFPGHLYAVSVIGDKP